MAVATGPPVSLSDATRFGADLVLQGLWPGQSEYKFLG